MGLKFLEGNEAIALGALKAGCNFFAGYPITPATTIFNTMIRYLPPRGGICLQGEDEIASIGFCIGASMAGHKAMTATSGPGISLYSEHISFAVGSEIPLVIVDVQRLGPSTGSATRGADGDIQFLNWSNSGGLPVIVLCPVNVVDCYVMAIEAFNFAEQYRCPVFIASNKEIALTRESIDIDKLILPSLVERSIFKKKEFFLPFDTSKNKIVPDFLPIGDEDVLVRQTSSTHGIDGYITVDSDKIDYFQRRLNKKFDYIVNDRFCEKYIEEGADKLIICYGITARSAKEVYQRRRVSNISVSLLILKMLWPVPEKIIFEVAQSVKKVVVVEMNLGLYVREVQRVLNNVHVVSVCQMDGRLISPMQIERAL